MDFLILNILGFFEIKIPGNGPFVGPSWFFRALSFKLVLKNLFPSLNEGSTMYSFYFESFRVHLADLSRCNVFLLR